MTTPDPSYECRILRDVVEQMADPEATERKQASAQRLILGLGCAGLAAAYFLALNSLTHPLASGLVAAGAGCAVGFSQFLSFARKQWPVTRRHINMESVRRRLEELDGRPPV